MAEERQKRWETSATVLVDTDWFDADISGRGGHTVKHTLQIMVPTSTVVNLQVVFNSITKTLDLNEGIALNANAAYQFDFLVFPGMTYNVQHKTTTQNMACFIAESENADV